MNGQVKFIPVTREMLYQHALHLLATGEEHVEEAISLLKRAEAFGHGKASNIFAQLAINPQERDISKLTQAPKKKFIGK